MYELHRTNPPWEVNSHSACQISHLLWNKMCIIMLTQAPQLVNILSHMNPDHTPHSHPQDPFQVIMTSTLRFHMWSLSDLQVFQLKMYVDFTSLSHRLHTKSISPSLFISLIHSFIILHKSIIGYRHHWMWNLSK